MVVRVRAPFVATNSADNHVHCDMTTIFDATMATARALPYWFEARFLCFVD